MKTTAVCGFLMLLLSQLATCGIIRNPPAFSKPVYSNSYLPAAMQVIFHAVEQLKMLQSEESLQTITTARTPLTSPITHKVSTHQPSTTISTTSTTTTTTTSTTVQPLLDTTKIEEEVEDPKVEVPAKNRTEEESKIEENRKPEESQTEEASKDKGEQQSQDKLEASKDKVDELVSSTPVEINENSMKEKPEQQSQDTLESSEDNADKIDQPNAETEKGKEEEGLSDEPKQDHSEASNIEQPSNDKAEQQKGMEEAEETSKADENDGEGFMGNPVGHEESPEVNEETPEANYATPETNYEAAEVVHAAQETNQEIPEENHEWSSSFHAETNPEAATSSGNPADAPANQESIARDKEEEKNEKKEPTIDSVVQGVYEILKPTTSKFVDEEPSGESKSVNGMSVEGTESVEEEDDETRFTRLGEKVTQVPRPSLSSYVRRLKVPPSATLQQLANLYDSLSKDARKQGFGKYTGYSDEVLNTLESSAEGGMGSQLKKILAKVLERNELTREDAKIRTSQAVKDLDNPSSSLSKELRSLVPLRYSS